MRHPTLVRVKRLLVVVAAVVAAACDRKDAATRVAPPLDPPVEPVVANAPGAANAPGGDAPSARVVIPNVVVAAKGTTTVHVGWKLPAGTGVNDGAPFRVRWTSSEGLLHAPEDMRAKGADVTAGFDVAITPTAGAPSALLAGDVNVVVCDVATHRVCVPVTRRIEMTFLAEGHDAAALVTVPLPEARPQS